MSLDVIIRSVSTYSPLLIFAMVNRHSLANSNSLLIILLSACSFAADMLTRHFFPYQSTFIFSGYALIEIGLIGSFFHLTTKKKYPFLIYTAILLLLYGTTIYFSGNEYNSIGDTLESIVMILWSMIYFYDIYYYERDLFIEHSGNFWFVVGILAYFSGALFSFLLSKEILNGPMVWTFHNLANILKNLCFTIGIWKCRTTA